MQTGMSTASLFNRCNVEDAPEKLSAFGMDVCELFLNTFSEYEESFVDMLAERVQAAGLRVYSVHPMGTQFEPQLFSLHARQRSDAFNIYEKVLRAGRRLGASCYVMHGPATLGGAVKNMEFFRIGPIVRELCEIAAGYGMVVAWENVSWGLFATPAFGPQLLEASKADDLRFTLDIKQAARSGCNPLEFLACMGDKLANVHICDYIAKAGRIQPMLPGRGEADLPALRDALLQAGYAGPVFFEIYSDLYQTESEMLESYALVRRIFS